MPNGGYVPENGISVCHRCHQLAEIYHSTGGTRWYTGLHPNDLYRLIGSSKELAIQASQKLSNTYYILL